MPPVSDVQLTDLATVKRWLNIAAADTGADVELTRLITVATRLVKEYTNRPIFISSTITETPSIVGNTSNRIRLSTTPVTAITSISEDGQTLVPYSSSFTSGYRFDQYGILGGYRSFYTSSVYIVVYTGGFLLTSQEAYLAEQAVVSTINLWWKRRVHADEVMRSLGNQITSKYTEDELPPEATAIIRPLKRVA